MPAPFGADESKAVAAHHAQVEITHHGATVECLGHVAQFRHQLARALAGIDVELDVAQPLAPRVAVASQLLQPFHAAFVARASRLDALADPDLFLRPELVELAVEHGFLGQLLRLASLVRRVVAGVRTQHAAIEFDDARGDPVEERAVVRDDDGGRAARDEQVLEPFDAVDVEVVRGFVEQHHVGLERERARQRGTFAFAAGEARGGRRAFQPEAMQVLDDARVHPPAHAIVVDRVEFGPEREGLPQGGRGRQFRLLADRYHAQAAGFLQFRRRRAQSGR